MKIFWAKNYISFINRIFIYSPIVIGCLLWIFEFNYDLNLIGIIIVSLIVSYIFYCCNLGWFIGYIIIKEQSIYVPGDLIPKFNKLQFEEKINFNDIIVMEFKTLDGNSKGDKLYRAWSINYLEITLRDNTIHRIVIQKFTHNQWKIIENIISSKVPDLIILKNCDEFIKLIKN